MRSDSNSDFGPLSDIAKNTAAARKFVKGMTFAEFEADLKTVYAVTRSLEIISEASRHQPTSKTGTQRLLGIKWQAPETYTATITWTFARMFSGGPCTSS